MNAKRNDPQLAQAVVAQLDGEDTGPQPTPPGSEWDQLAELQAAVFDRLGDLIRAVQHGYTNEQLPPVRPYPRPVTEMDRAKKRADEQADRFLEDLIAEAQQTHRTQQNREG